MEKIVTHPLTVSGIFNNFYTVPDYQREYVWGEREVNQLLTDIFDELDERSDAEYFIGTIVVCPGEDGRLDVIDGQQRITTLFLIISAFRFLLNQQNEDTADLRGMLFSRKRDAATGQSRDSYRLSLQYEETSGVLEGICGDADLPQDLRASGKRIADAYVFARQFLEQNCRGDRDTLMRFLGFFLNNVKIIQIQTPRISEALKIFETINERGVGLNPMDLLKNLLFRSIQTREFNALKRVWKEMTRTLEKEDLKPLRFLRYFIMANYRVKNSKGEPLIREDEIYEWFTNDDNARQCGYQQNAMEFAKLLQTNAEAYANFFAGKNADGERNIALENIKLLSGAASFQLILLIAARTMERSLFEHFTKQIEVLLFYFIITRTQSKEYERIFATWAEEIRSIKNKDDLNAFIQTRVEPVVDKARKNFDHDFGQIALGPIQKYRIHYVLAKLTSFVDQQVLGNNEEQPLDAYYRKGIQIEHILPDTPKEELKQQFGAEIYDDYKIKLGNLTFLERPMNIVASNGFFPAKCEKYKQCAFHLTKSIAETMQVGTNTSADRMYAQLKKFDQWDRNSIEQRQTMLKMLGDQIWKVSVME